MSRLYFRVLKGPKIPKDVKKNWKSVINKQLRLYPIKKLNRIPINGNKHSKFAIYTNMENPDIDLLPKLFGKIIKEDTNYLWGILYNPQKRKECMMFLININQIMTVDNEEVICPIGRTWRVLLKEVTN